MSGQLHDPAGGKVVTVIMLQQVVRIVTTVLEGDIRKEEKVIQKERMKGER
jgi:hypothetical protein